MINQRKIKKGRAMKKTKGIKIVALVAVILVFASCMMAPTLSRYVGKTSVMYKGETELDYTVNSVFTVNSQEELFAAINQGYTYVQLSKDIENPLIITQQSTNLESDLILDLNGIGQDIADFNGLTFVILNIQCERR